MFASTATPVSLNVHPSMWASVSTHTDTRGTSPAGAGPRRNEQFWTVSFGKLVRIGTYFIKIRKVWRQFVAKWRTLILYSSVAPSQTRGQKKECSFLPSESLHHATTFKRVKRRSSIRFLCMLRRECRTLLQWPSSSAAASVSCRFFYGRGHSRRSAHEWDFLLLPSRNA